MLRALTDSDLISLKKDHRKYIQKNYFFLIPVTKATRLKIDYDFISVNFLCSITT